jgi:hypothetical protein
MAQCARYFTLVVIFFLGSFTFAQKVSDSIVKHPKSSEWIVWTATGTAGLGSLVALNQLWYADYPRSAFHWKNDNNEWLQMDKMGHGYAGYQLSSTVAEGFEAAGVKRSKAVWHAALISWTYLAGIELMDGFSSQWGASYGDLLANTTGAGLFVVQDQLWHEQRILPKFSYHTTPYPGLRPQVLGQSATEQLIKDYNGQTYWLSANIRSFIHWKPIPTWLNIAVGYGGRGMITGDDLLVNDVFFPDAQRSRKFYVSFDVDLTKIKTKNTLLKYVFKAVNLLKIPAPTLSFSTHGKPECYGLYF